jgi:hypothetical protein
MIEASSKAYSLIGPNPNEHIRKTKPISVLSHIANVARQITVVVRTAGYL